MQLPCLLKRCTISDAAGLTSERPVFRVLGKAKAQDHRRWCMSGQSAPFSHLVCSVEAITNFVQLPTMNSKNKSSEYTLLAREEDSEQDQPLNIRDPHHSRWHSKALHGAFYLVIGCSLLLNIAQLIRLRSGSKASAFGDRSVTAYGM
ncbi:hypothetical protein CC80DRAFT_249868 [Byssothecium circinans]|uniref:Uncharacterized protein n=1 Tax=Byssothecium circinans TaxID=147558 RepID=A0A6A5TB10_9PLEO|nr:hypothetical protein CC80DRAFT_249868 [Byssothecium circinans]